MSLLERLSLLDKEELFVLNESLKSVNGILSKIVELI